MSYPLTPVPHSLGLPDGHMSKTDKSTLLHYLVDCIPDADSRCFHWPCSLRMETLTRVVLYNYTPCLTSVIQVCFCEVQTQTFCWSYCTTLGSITNWLCCLTQEEDQSITLTEALLGYNQFFHIPEILLKIQNNYWEHYIWLLLELVRDLKYMQYP